MIKIALPSNGKNLLSPLANTFERCSYFIITDLYGIRVTESVLNVVQDAARGAGEQAAQILVNENINVLITPLINNGALKILLNAGIKIYLGIVGTIQDNLEAYKQRRLIETKIAIDLNYPEAWLANLSSKNLIEINY